MQTLFEINRGKRLPRLSMSNFRMVHDARPNKSVRNLKMSNRPGNKTCRKQTRTTDLDSPENSPKSQSRSMTYTPVAKRMKQEETARKTMEQLQLEVLQQQGEVLRQQKQLNEQLSQVLSHFSDVLDQISATLPSQDNGRNEMAQWPL